MNVDADGT
jgi:hypothetical protein